MEIKIPEQIKDFINGKVTYDKDGGYFWINEPNGGIQMLAEMRGWGHIQNMFKDGSGYNLTLAEAFQDKVGEFIAESINEKNGNADLLKQNQDLKAANERLQKNGDGLYKEAYNLMEHCIDNHYLDPDDETEGQINFNTALSQWKEGEGK